MVVHPTAWGTLRVDRERLPLRAALPRSSGKRDALQRRAEHELAGVQHERLVAPLDQLGQVVLRSAGSMWV